MTEPSPPEITRTFVAWGDGAHKTPDRLMKTVAIVGDTPMPIKDEPSVAKAWLRRETGGSKAK